MRLDLQVTLKTIDLVRATAWLSLSETLGWAGVLEKLERRDLWRFEGEGNSPDAFRASLDRELERTSSYYNPNKQSLEFLPAQGRDEGAILNAGDAKPRPATPASGRWLARVWVTDDGGERPDLMRGSNASLRADGVRLRSLRSGTLWLLTLRAADEAEAKGLTAAIAITRSRREGLLLNPQYQEGHLLSLTELPATPAMDEEA